MKSLIFVALSLSVSLSANAKVKKGGSQVGDAGKASLLSTTVPVLACDSERFFGIAIVKETLQGKSEYILRLTSEGRERAGIGMFNDASNDVVFGLEKKEISRGKIEFKGHFEMDEDNWSDVSLVALKKGDAYELRLSEGSYKGGGYYGNPNPSNAAYAFFKERMQNLLFESGATSTDGYLNCK